MAKKQQKMARKVSKVTTHSKKSKRKKTGCKRKKNVKYRKKPNVGLDKTYFSKVKQEFHDIDYTKELNDKQKAFLSTFMEEELGARLNHKGRILNKSKKQRKRVFDANNARQRDVYSQLRAQGRLFFGNTTEVIERWQEMYNDPDADAVELQQIEDQEELTREEFNDLMKSGAIVPDDLKEYYKKKYQEN